MSQQSSERTIKNIFDVIGIKINGDKPGDIQVHNQGFYNRILLEGSLGFAQSYMDGWWDSDSLDETFKKLLKSNVHRIVRNPGTLFEVIKSKVINPQSITRSKRVAEVHYDLSNEFYEAMLGRTMQYTCAYWKDSKTLDEAQENKMNLVAKKLQLKEGDNVLELGGGWGVFAKFISENYGCRVTSYNISKNQTDYAKRICRGLPIEIICQDYRLAEKNHENESFDKIVSVGLCEHVGHKNYRSFMRLCNRLLKPNSLFLLHTIGKDITETKIDPFIRKFIFPGGMLPSLKLLSEASEGSLVQEDLQNFGAYYDRTLMEWNKNFQASWNDFKDEFEDKFKNIFKRNSDKKFKRMWEYYLKSCAGGFRSRRLHLWQIVYSKDGIIGGYERVS